MDKRLLKYFFFVLIIAFACPVLAQRTDSLKNQVRIICLGSVDNRKILYVLDGRKIADSLIDKDLKNLNPNDILEVTVLKDDSSAKTLYGVRGRLGVVIVVTKKYAVKKYQDKLGLISKNYKSYLEKHNGDDSGIFYILDGTVLESGGKYNLAKMLYDIRDDNVHNANFVEMSSSDNQLKRTPVMWVTTKDVYYQW